MFSAYQAHRGAPLAGVLLCRSAHRSLEGAPWVSSCSVVQCIKHLMASLSIVQLPMLACGGREAMVMAPPPTYDSAVSPCFHGCPAFLHRHFPPQSPPHIPLSHLSAVNSSPHPGISPQPLNSSSQPLHLPGDQHPCLGYVWLKQGLSDSHST